MILLTKGQIFAPEAMGLTDLLIAGGQIVALSPGIDLRTNVAVDVVDLEGKTVVPGFIDAHVHIAGGGGEGGFQNRTPEIRLSRLTGAGITTVVGLLGTDGVTRTVSGLLAKARALEAEGITAYIYSGAYQLPTRTITGDLRSDLVLIDKVIGVGEIAISDHRSSHPSHRDLAMLASEARVGGLLGGKAGVVHLHMGDDPGGLAPVIAAVDQDRIPVEQFVPTHVNRNAYLMEQAVKFARMGGCLDLTSGISPQRYAESAVRAGGALRYLLEHGVEPSRITVSSDGNGSAPLFDEEGHLFKMGIGSVNTLWKEVRAAIVEEGVAFTTALATITSNVARILKLEQKGRIVVNADADLVILDARQEIWGVMACGRWMVKEGQPVVFGTFEKCTNMVE